MAVFPSSVEAGSAQWLTIEGEGFEPLVRLDARNRELDVDEGFRVRVGEFWSEEVFWSGTDRLMAALPPGLPSGEHDVLVSSPSGAQSLLPGALCAGERVARHVAFVFVDQSGYTSLVTVDDSQRPNWEPREIMQGAFFDLHRPVAISQQSKAITAIGVRRVGTDLMTDLVVLYPWTVGNQLDPPIVLRSSSLEALEQQVFSMPVFSRDGRHLVYTEGEGRRLLSQPVPEPGAEAEEPVVLWEEAPDSNYEVRFPDVDPSGHRVVFSRVRYEPLECDLDQIDDPDRIEDVARVSLWQVPISGGEALPLLDEEGVSNGPAAFSPAGDKLFYMSDRLGMVFPVQENRCVNSVTNIYSMDLVTGEVSSVTKPMAMAPFGPPHISPDGRWLAVPGYLADTVPTPMDLILIDIENGVVYRAATQAEGDCSQSPQSCLSIMLMPAFAPDSRSLFATGIPLHDQTRAFLMEIQLPGGVLDLPAYDRTLPQSHVEFFGQGVIAARAVDFYAGCVED